MPPSFVLDERVYKSTRHILLLLLDVRPVLQKVGHGGSRYMGVFAFYARCRMVDTRVHPTMGSDL